MTDILQDKGPAGRRGRALAVAIGLAVCAMGVSSVTAQLVLMRELLTAFAGNELVFGVILGNWLALTGVGAYLGRLAGRGRWAVGLSALVVGQTLLAVLPVASVYGLRVLRNVVFVRGAALGLTEAALTSLVLLLPYCLASGFLLTVACSVVARGARAGSIARVYMLDSLGGVAGGCCVSFVLVYLLGHFGILYVPAALNLVCAAAVAALAGRRVLASVAAVVAAGMAALALGVDLEEVSLAAEYPGQRIVYHANSPYGQLLVTRSGRQYNVIAGGLPLFATGGQLAAEETAHFAMAQRPRAANVLLISGGVSGTAREILKYPVRRLDYVELDPLIIQVARRYFPEALADPRIHLATTDGRLFVRQADRKYDVVIMDTPSPSTLQINRLYTVEFFRDVRRILSPGGVLAFSLGEYENYVSRNLATRLSVVHRTLGEARFLNVLVLPPGRVFFLASDGELTSDVAGAVEEAGVQTEWMHAGYLQTVLTPYRMIAVRGAVSPDAPANRDFQPVLYTQELLHWMSRFPVRTGLLAGAMVLVAALGVYLVRLRAVSLAILTTGFAASALEVVLLAAMQILHGMVYRQVGAIVTLFMAGLVAGSLTVHRLLPRWGRRDLVKLELAIAGFALVLPAVLTGLSRLSGGLGPVAWPELVLPALAFVLAALVGMEFPLAARADFDGVTPTAARLYLADMVGACLGAMLVSTLLIPLVGVAGACLLAAGLNGASAGVLLLTRGRGR